MNTFLGFMQKCKPKPELAKKLATIARKIVDEKKLGKPENDLMLRYWATWKIEEYAENETQTIDGLIVPSLQVWRCGICKDDYRHAKTVMQESKHYSEEPVKCDCGRPMHCVTQLTDEQKEVLRVRQ
jgi:hypothetical protein